MEAIFPGQNIKVVAKALQCLSKVGDELFLKGQPDKLSLITFNSAKTICTQFHFLLNFFSHYGFPNGQDEIICKMQMKIVLPIFKNNLERKVDYFKIEYENENDFILFKMRYTNDEIIMVHKMRLMEGENLSIEFDPNSTVNSLNAPASVFNQILTMFNASDDEVTMEFTTNNVNVKNYCTGTQRKTKSMRSQITLCPSDFESFSITEETTLNFSVKPLRTAVNFAEGVNLNIAFNFQSGNRPLAIILKDPTFELNFIVATVNPNVDDSTVETSSVKTIKNKKTDENVNNITLDDIRALQSEDWNDFQVENKENGEDNAQEKTEDVTEPMSKRAKMVFRRCTEATFHETLIQGRVIAENSDSE